MSQPAISFVLRPADAVPISVTLRRGTAAWTARVDGLNVTGVGSSARAALAAAAAALGQDAAVALLADVGLLQPSLQVLQVERAAAV
jgi:hypothetical protein